MNAVGANAWIWVSPPTDERIAWLAPHVAALGFDQIEIPVEGVSDWDPARTAELLSGLGLRASVCCAMGPGRDLTTDDAETTRATQTYLRACVDAVLTLGGDIVCGPIYTPVGRTWLMTADERKTVVDRVVNGLRPVAEYAGERGVRLAVEPINRFETSVLNTMEQTLDVVEDVGSAACGILLDTFHMNIEEKHPGRAIRAAGHHLVHVHACGSDRGAPGGDHTPWDDIRAALAEIDYSGAIVIESFTSENVTIATAASIWRPLAPSQDAIAVDGLNFLRGLMATGF